MRLDNDLSSIYCDPHTKEREWLARGPMSHDFDIIVVGSGAGGGTFAYACAKAGKSVLLVERGEKPVLQKPVHDEQAMLIEKKPYDDRPIRVNGSPRLLYMGGIFGGGTSLYGAALMRPSRDDFHPGKHYEGRIPRAIWDWPIPYEMLEPYYAEAEKLYGVSGCSEEDFGPLQKPPQGYPHRPIPLKPINQRLIAANKARGLKPFSLPLAIDFTRCLQCGSCPGFVCLNGARRSSAQLLEKAVAESLPLHVLTGVEVESFSRAPRARSTASACATASPDDVTNTGPGDMPWRREPSLHRRCCSARV